MSVYVSVYVSVCVCLCVRASLCVCACDGWQTGDEAVLKLDTERNQLKMWHKRSNRIYALDLPGNTSWRLNFNLHTHPSVVVVSLPSRDEERIIHARTS